MTPTRSSRRKSCSGKVRSGRIRMLFGSTPKMGAGTNVQNRLVALHHLDAPWRPSDLEQREGRGIRQGNELYAEDPDGFEIEILRYATKNTLDSRQWQTIEGKARFIQQLRKGGTKQRQIEDIAGEVANAAEMKAAASGNPLILEEMDLRQKIRKLEGQAAEHDREQHRIRMRVRDLQDEGARIKSRMPALEADAERARRTIAAGFNATVEGTAAEKPKDLGAAILKAGQKFLKAGSEGGAIGTYGEFGLSLSYDHTRAFSLDVEGDRQQQIYIEDLDNTDPTGLARRVMNTVSSLEVEPKHSRERAAEIDRQIPALEKQIGAWEHQQELDELTARHRAVLTELQPKKKEAPAAAEGESKTKTDSQGPSDEHYSIAAGPRSLGIPEDTPVLFVHRNDQPMKQNENYKAAKAGDFGSAVRLVEAIAPSLATEAAKKFGSDVVFVAPHAEEASGRNVIPQALASYLAKRSGAMDDQSIIQSTRAFHTGARPLDRMLGRPQFSGPVEVGKRYVLVDDVTLMGARLPSSRTTSGRGAARSPGS